MPRDLAACQALADAPLRRPLRIVTVEGDRRVVHRLAALGLVPGAAVQVLRSRGTLILAVGDTRLALGAVAAASIVVEPL